MDIRKFYKSLTKEEKEKLKVIILQDMPIKIDKNKITANEWAIFMVRRNFISSLLYNVIIQNNNMTKYSKFYYYPLTEVTNYDITSQPRSGEKILQEFLAAREYFMNNEIQ